MRFAHYGPRSRFRSEKTNPYGIDLPVITGGVTLALIMLVIVAFVFPAMFHAWHELPRTNGGRPDLFLAAVREVDVAGEVVIRYALDTEGAITTPEVISSAPAGVYDEIVLDHLATMVFEPMPTVPRNGQALITQVWRFTSRAEREGGRNYPAPYPMMYERIVCGRFDQSPRLLSRVEPVLPARSERDAGDIEQVVVEEIPLSQAFIRRTEILVTFTLESSGRVAFPKVTLGQEILTPAQRRAVQEAIKEWHFEPATREGKPVPVEVTQRIDLIDQLDRLFPDG